MIRSLSRRCHDCSRKSVPAVIAITVPQILHISQVSRVSGVFSQIPFVPMSVVFFLEQR